MMSLKDNSGFKLWRDRKSGKISRRKTIDTETRRMQDANVISAVIGGKEDIVSCEKNGKGEVIRMKILVRKENLEKVLEAIGANTGKSSDTAPSSSLYLEECIIAMKRRRISRANQVKLRCHNDSSWRPALHSIPE